MSQDEVDEVFGDCGVEGHAAKPVAMHKMRPKGFVRDDDLLSRAVSEDCAAGIKSGQPPNTFQSLFS